MASESPPALNGHLLKWRTDAGLRVLIADAYADAADTSALLLRLWGYDVHVAYTGPAALECARAYRPHLVLTEICLPELDGFRLAQALRGQAVVVAVTVLGQPAYRQRAHEAGIAHYLLKPADPEVLRGLLLFVERHRHEVGNRAQKKPR